MEPAKPHLVQPGMVPGQVHANIFGNTPQTVLPELPPSAVMASDAPSIFQAAPAPVVQSKVATAPSGIGAGVKVKDQAPSPIQAPVVRARGFFGRLAAVAQRVMKVNWDGLNSMASLGFAPIFAPQGGSVLGVRGGDLKLPDGLQDLGAPPSRPHPKEAGGSLIQSFKTLFIPGFKSAINAFDSEHISLLQQVDVSDKANLTENVTQSLLKLVDSDPTTYQVPSSQLRVAHVTYKKGESIPLADGRVFNQGETVYAVFQQTKDGLDIEGAVLRFTLKVVRGKLEIVTVENLPYPNVDVDAKDVNFTDEALREKALNLRKAYADKNNRTLKTGLAQKKILYLKGAWHAVNVHLIMGGEIPFYVAMDRASGEAFDWDARVKIYSGTVKGNVVADGPMRPGAKLEPLLFPFLEVKVNGEKVITDKDGSFTNVRLNLSEEIEVDATLIGPYVRVLNDAGEPASFRVKVRPKGDDQYEVIFNPDASLNDEKTLAQVMAFCHRSIFNRYLAKVGLNIKALDVQVQLHVNVNDECNAYYVPGNAKEPAIYMFQSSPGCVSSAYNDVNYHESGHNVDDFIAPGIINGSLSEAYGDTFTMFITGQPIVGRGFMKNPGPDGKDYIRSGENTHPYSGENEEVHEGGQVYMGVLWKFYLKLEKRLGKEVAQTLIEAAAFPAMLAKSGTTPGQLTQVLLNLMDKDGNISLENLADFRASAEVHGIAISDKPTKGGGRSTEPPPLPPDLGPLAFVGKVTAWVMGAAVAPIIRTQAQPVDIVGMWPHVKGDLKFTAGLLYRSGISRELKALLAQQQAQGAIAYDLTEDRGLWNSDFDLNVRGPEQNVQTVLKAVRDWLVAAGAKKAGEAAVKPLAQPDPTPKPQLASEVSAVVLPSAKRAEGETQPVTVNFDAMTQAKAFKDHYDHMRADIGDGRTAWIRYDVHAGRFMINVAAMSATGQQFGTVKWFNDSKGFGFITTADGQDVFVHHAVIEGKGYHTLLENGVVSLEVRETDKGLSAAHVWRLYDSQFYRPMTDSERKSLRAALQSRVETSPEFQPMLDYLGR